jgi:hypothetical protein
VPLTADFNKTSGLAPAFAFAPRHASDIRFLVHNSFFSSLFYTLVQQKLSLSHINIPLHPYTEAPCHPVSHDPSITMKYSTVILAFVASVFASPQASITSAPVVAAPIPSGLTPQVSCALACNAGDVTCQAACLGNARPNASQAIDTNNCAAKCDQGDGSAAAATAFAKCVDGCINSLFPSSQTAFAPGAAQAASSAAARASGTGNPTASASK